MPSPTGKRSYEQLLNSQLDVLRQTLLQQYLKDTEDLKKTVAQLRQQLPSNDAIDDDVEKLATENPLPSAMRWERLAEKLLDKQEEAPPKEGELDEKGEQEYIGLCLRPVWCSSSWKQVAKEHIRGRHSESGTLAGSRMNDDLTDNSCLQRFVLRPRSKFQLAWSLVGTLFILWDLITIPLELFNIPGSIDFFSLVSRITLAFWVFDMPLNLCFGVERHGRVELRPIELLRIYLRSWFVLDVLVISLDVTLMVIDDVMSNGGEGNAGLRSARFLRTMRLLRLLRLLRAVKLQQELTLLANRFLSTHVFMVAKVVFGLLMMLAINHIIACLWYGIGSWSSLDGNSWLRRAQMEEAGFADAYAVSIHWTLTQFTPATNNVAPDNALERFFAVWVILLAMGVFSSFISSITATVSTLRNSRVEQFHQRAKLLRFFCDRNLSADLYGKVEDVLRQEGLFEVRVKERDVKLFSGIPERLKMQLHEEMFLSLLASFPFWPKYNEESDLVLHRLICHQAMREDVAVPGQDAFIAGQDATEVFIIQSGSMGYLYFSGQKIEDSVEEQDIVSLPCLFAEWKYRGRLFASRGSCYYVGLRADRFCSLVTEHGGGVWQHLHIFGILLVGAIEHKGSTINDINWKTVGMEELCQRTSKYASIMIENHGTQSATLTLMKSFT